MEELLGCWREAQRADKVAAHLLSIRNLLGLEFHDHFSPIIREVEQCSRLLRDLYDLFPIYRFRVPIILYYLNIILPSICKRLQEMMIYLDNDGLSSRERYTLMSKRLRDQGGMSLVANFVMFNEYLTQIIRLLSKSPLYDPTTLELLRMRIIRLRHLQNIPAPPQALQQAPPAATVTELDTQRRHWAERVFEDPPHSTTGLRHHRMSRCFGPPMMDIRLGITPGSTVLFKLPFDKNSVSITLYLQPESPNTPRLLCRWMDRYFNPLYSCYGIHELIFCRKGSSLQFRRWSTNRMHPVLWLALFFKTWEKMVLLHCCLGAAKSRSPLTVNIAPDDLILAGERRLFQGKIVDDGFEHMLTVLQDDKCGGIRLHAAVRNGELRRCPIWTAFVTHQSASPNWIERRSRHRVRLQDVYPYVFCQSYKKKNQIIRGKFEIYFVNEEAADAFEETFREGSEFLSVVLEGEGPFEVQVQSQETNFQNLSRPTFSENVDIVEEDSKNSKGDEKVPEVDIEIANWQSSLENPTVQEDLSVTLFENCANVFPLIYRILKKEAESSERSACEDLREEFRRFYVWNEIFPTASGELGSILSTSRNLKETVFSLMAQWARALCRVPKVIPGCEWGSIIPEISQLEVVSSKMEQVVAAISRSQFSADEQNLKLPLDLAFDDISDSASIESTGSVGSIIDEMKVCTECLVDLLPSLEAPASDMEARESTRAPVLLAEELQPWWHHFRGTEDKFPSAERELLILIGETIWRRWEKIRLRHAARTEVFGNKSVPVTYKPAVDDEFGSYYSESMASSGKYTKTRMSSFSGGSVFDQDHNTTFKFKEPGLQDFPKRGARRGPENRIWRQDSVSSFRSSIVTNAPKSSQRQVPPMPIECRNGEDFECFICQEIIKDIRTREMWKKHIFSDLEPYICTFGKCSESLKTFKSRYEWSKHESTVHEAQFQKRLESGECPLCLAAIRPAKNLSRHIGRHLRELSLASLPLIESSITNHDIDDDGDQEDEGDYSDRENE